MFLLNRSRFDDLNYRNQRRCVLCKTAPTRPPGPVTSSSSRLPTDASFRSVPPGSYKLFAWEGIELFSWFDPEVLAQYETQRVSTTVNGTNVILDLKAIA